MSTSSLERTLKCPICLDIMTIPIIQCENGHNMSSICVEANSVKACPACKARLTHRRNHDLEQIIASIELQNKVKIQNNCRYADKGCKYALKKNEKDAHERECRFRPFVCEGKRFSNWACLWSGNYQSLEKHFTECHVQHTRMTFRTEASMKMDFKRDFSDVQLINFHNGQNFFWYKHKLDTKKKKAFWTIQFIGTAHVAKNYFYEFEIYGAVRKIKVTEICENDAVDANEIFESEKCVAVSFRLLETFFDEEGELPFKFRIMSIKKT